MEKPEGSKCENSQRKDDSQHVPDVTCSLPPQSSGPSSPGQTKAEPRWREVAAQAASETNPERLSHLVDELIRLLDEERRGKRPPKDQP
jgi:hypothetical protein